MVTGFWCLCQWLVVGGWWLVVGGWRCRPFLLFDDDSRVYLFTSVSPSNTSTQMYTHVQEVTLPPGVAGPHTATVH